MNGRNWGHSKLLICFEVNVRCCRRDQYDFDLSNCIALSDFLISFHGSPLLLRAPS